MPHQIRLAKLFRRRSPAHLARSIQPVTMFPLHSQRMSRLNRFRSGPRTAWQKPSRYLCHQPNGPACRSFRGTGRPADRRRFSAFRPAPSGKTGWLGQRL